MGSDRWVGSSTPYLHPSGDTWKKEAATAGRTGGQRIAFAGETTPPDGVAEQLDLPAGDLAVMRRRLILLDGRAVEIADSYWPKEIAAGTALADPGKIRGGAVSLLADMGKRPSRIEEQVSARPQTPEEQRTLETQDGDWVLVLNRLIKDDADQPYEVSVMVTPARTRQLNYAMKVD